MSPFFTVFFTEERPLVQEYKSCFAQNPPWNKCFYGGVVIEGFFLPASHPFEIALCAFKEFKRANNSSPVHRPGVVQEWRQSQTVASVCSAPRPTSLHLCPWKEILNNLILILTLPYTYRTWILLIFSVDHHPVGGVAINTVLNRGVELKWIWYN